MAIYKRNGIWWLDVYVGADRRRIRKSTGVRDEVQARIIEQAAVAVNRGITTRKRAMAIIDNLLPAGERGVPLLGIPAFYKSCIESEGLQLSHHTLCQRLRVLTVFCEWAKNTTRVSNSEEVDATVAFAYSLELGKREILGKSRNSYLGDLATVWKMLLKRGKVKENPWSVVRVRRDRENEHTGRAFTAVEIERTLAVSRRVGHDWEGMVLIGLYTGLRMRDIANLTWQEVDLERGVLSVIPNKTRRHGISVMIPIHRNLASWLSSRCRVGKYVLPDRAGKCGDGCKYRNGDVPFSKILTDAGITGGERDKISFHCLRYTFISRLAEVGVAEDIRMRLAGHSNADTHAIYTHDDVSARRAIDLLP